MNWGGMYAKILEDMHNGTWTNEDIWWLAAEGAALLGGSEDEMINPKFVEDLKKVEVNTSDLGKLSVYDTLCSNATPR